MGKRILLIEDDVELGGQVAERLRREGYEVEWWREGPSIVAHELADVALVILDIMLPGTYGLDILREVRAHAETPLLILSARNDTHDRVRALRLGADDYMTKPFWPDELIERVRARLRRPALSWGDVIEIGGLRIDLAMHRVQVGGATVELTRVEFEFLVALTAAQEARFDGANRDGVGHRLPARGWRSMKLRLRLAVATIAVVVPTVVALRAIDRHSRRQTTAAALIAMTERQLDAPGEQVRCEAAAATWTPPPPGPADRGVLMLLPASGWAAPRPPLPERTPRPTREAIGGPLLPPPPGVVRLDPRRLEIEIVPLDADLRPARPDGPAVPRWVGRELARGEPVVLLASLWDDVVEVVVRAPWWGGPCAHIYVRGRADRGVGSLLPSSWMWLVPIAAVMAAVLSRWGPWSGGGPRDQDPAVGHRAARAGPARLPGQHHPRRDDPADRAAGPPRHHAGARAGGPTAGRRDPDLGDG